jgi:hypothetical protein
MLVQRIAVPDAGGHVPEPVSHGSHGGEGPKDREQHPKTEFQVSHYLGVGSLSRLLKHVPSSPAMPLALPPPPRAPPLPIRPSLDRHRLPQRPDAVDLLRFLEPALMEHLLGSLVADAEVGANVTDAKGAILAHALSLEPHPSARTIRPRFAPSEALDGLRLSLSCRWKRLRGWDSNPQPTD